MEVEGGATMKWWETIVDASLTLFTADSIPVMVSEVVKEMLSLSATCIPPKSMSDSISSPLVSAEAKVVQGTSLHPHVSTVHPEGER